MTQNERIDKILSEYLSFLKYPKSYNPYNQSNLNIYWSGMLSTPNLEVPTIVTMNGIINKAYNMGNENGYTTAIIPFSNGTSEYASVKTAFIKYGTSVKIGKINIKGEYFYLCNGVIMDINKEILFMVTQSYNPVATKEDAFTNVYFNPKVFRKGNAINKFIADILFPFIMEYKINPAHFHTGHLNIIMEEYKGLYSVPLKSNPLETTNMAYGILDEYLESVCATITQ